VFSLSDAETCNAIKKNGKVSKEKKPKNLALLDKMPPLNRFF